MTVPQGPSGAGSDSRGLWILEVTMSLFVLVHGAYHGGWCWSRLVPELERSRAPRRLRLTCPATTPLPGYDEYVAAVLDAMELGTGRSSTAGGGADVVVVGHSLGGFTVPLVAQRRPVRRLVFLCTAPVIGGPRADELRARMVTARFGAMVRFRDEQDRGLMSAARRVGRLLRRLRRRDGRMGDRPPTSAGRASDARPVADHVVARRRALGDPHARRRCGVARRRRSKPVG